MYYIVHKNKDGVYLLDESQSLLWKDKDLNKFISYVEKLKRSYADSNIEIGDLLHEITHNYTEN